MKKIITLCIISFSFFYSITFTFGKNQNSFALTAIGPNQTVSTCVGQPQYSLLEALRHNNFNPLQDNSGFIYSLINYAGPKSTDPASRNAFWSLWIEDQSDYVFSNLGAQNLLPENKKSYVFYFGNGKTKPPLVKYADICRQDNLSNQSQSENSADKAKPTSDKSLPVVAQTNAQTQEVINLQSSLNYLKDNYNKQSKADQDWGAIALASFNEPAPVKFSDDNDLLDLSRQLLALSAQNQNNSYPSNKIKSLYSNGGFGDPDLINDDIFATLAIVNVDKKWLDDKQEVFDTIIASQRSDGSFGFSKEEQGDVDMTAAAIWALKYKKDYPSTSINRAVKFLDQAQNSDGSYGYRPKTASNIPSTAWAAITYTAINKANTKVFDYLLSQKQLGGYWLYGNQSSYKSTAYAIIALSKKIIPFVLKKEVSPKPSSKERSTTIIFTKPAPTLVQSSIITMKESTILASSSSSASAYSSSSSASSSTSSMSCITQASASTNSTGAFSSASIFAFTQCD